MSARINDVVHGALLAHSKLPLRSENFDNTLVSFLDLAAADHGLTELENSDWQVIYGRRGTGKTYLLKSFEEKKRGSSISKTSRRQREDLFFYYSAQDFLVSDEYLPESRKALAYFQIFIDKLRHDVLSCVDGMLARDSTWSRLSGASSAKRSEIEDLALQISEVAQFGEVLSATAEHSIAGEVTNFVGAKSSRSLDFAGGASVGTEKVDAHLRSAFQFGSDRRAERGAKTVSSSKGRPVPRFDQIKGLVVKLLDALAMKRIIIVIDEWPLIDPSGIQPAQPMFANLLKRTFAGTGRISVKIATNRFQTRLSAVGEAGALRGLEIDADIFEAVNLDHALLAECELEAFYRLMIFKRLCFSSPKFSEMFLPVMGYSLDGMHNIFDVPQGFIEIMFKDEAAFRELTRGCEGIPREFLELFNRVAKKNGYRVEDRWSIMQVRDAIRESRASSQNNLDYNSPSYKFLNISIRGKVLDTGRREFAIHRENYARFSGILDVLLERRIIHEYPSGKIPEDFRNDFKVYLTDYGYCLDWARSYPQQSAHDEDREALFGNRCTRPTYSGSLLMVRLARDDEEIGQCRMRLMQPQTAV